MTIDSKDQQGYRVALTRIQGQKVEPVQPPPGAPQTPEIGAVPDKATQNIPLLDIISEKNYPQPNEAQEAEPEK